MSIEMILVIVLLFLALGGLPRWGYHRYVYGPSGILGSVFIIVLIMVLLGYL